MASPRHNELTFHSPAQFPSPPWLVSISSSGYTSNRNVSQYARIACSGLFYWHRLSKPAWNLTHWRLGDLAVIFKYISTTGSWGFSSENWSDWLLVNIGSGKGLVPSATSHYLSQCWPRSLLPFAVTRPQWVKARVSNYIKLGSVITGLHALAPLTKWPTFRRRHFQVHFLQWKFLNSD